MAIPTSRATEKGDIRIDHDICIGCGDCVEVCKDFSLVLRDGKADLSVNPAFGCIGCGHCMAICQTGAIRITGRTISPDDLFELPAAGNAADYDQIISLFRRRRSIREFRERHGIKYASREGLIVIFGYPSVEYKKGIRRTFASTTFMN